MKNIIVMAGTGIGLFVATAVGMLGIQGRLNYEGTRGIPVLSNFFAAPEESADEGHDGENAGHAAEQDDAHDPEEAVQVDLLSQSDGIQVVHKSMSPDGEGEGGGHEPAAEPGQDPAAGESAHGQPGQNADRGRQALEPTPREVWQEQSQAVRGNPGQFFGFPSMESPLTVKEINDIYRHAKASQVEVARRLEDLDQREVQLRQRERDVQDRAADLSDRILQIKRMEQELQDKVLDFNSKVLLVSKSREEDLKPIADRLASFDPAKAAELVRAYWETEAGKLKISMVLKIMDTEAANAILADMKVEEIKDIIDNLLKVHQESEGGN